MDRCSRLDSVWSRFALRSCARSHTTRCVLVLRRLTPEVGAGCGKAARPILCRGRIAICVPTAIRISPKGGRPPKAGLDAKQSELIRVDGDLFLHLMCGAVVVRGWGAVQSVTWLCRSYEDGGSRKNLCSQRQRGICR